MGFRTVVIKSRCKLEYRLNYLVIRGEEEKRVFINEINVLLIQSTAVAVTAALLCELIKNNVKVIFCDEKSSPHSELLPYYGAHNTSKRFKTQIAWKNDIKNEVWRVIISKKIENQAKLLEKRGFITESQMLRSYISEIEPGDPTNREGHAAKVYFNCILHQGSSRKDEIFINGCLNYGYAVILSLFNREIAASGYLTQIGIWHDNEFNQFNLSSDLMEPLRPVADEAALSIENGDKDFKKKMIEILNYSAVIDGKNTTLDVAAGRYAKSVLSALEQNDSSIIVFPEDVKKNG